MTEFNVGVAEDHVPIIRNTEDGPVEDVMIYYTIVATSPRGNVWSLVNSQTDDRTDAEEQLLEVQKAVLEGINPESNPDAWYECDPIYGSEAWGPEDEYNLACFEADCFGEPRPRW